VVLIATGDRDLKKVALTGNRPFPPDFAIRAWAYKGADDGETDRLKCNSKVVRSVSLMLTARNCANASLCGGTNRQDITAGS